MDQEIVVSLIMVAGLVLIVGHVSRLTRTILLNRTVRQAIERDASIADDLIQRLFDGGQGQSDSEERNGILLIALAAATFGYGLIQGDAETIRSLAGTALFPLFVGAALIARARIRARPGGRP